MINKSSLIKDINEYCKLNQIDNVEEFMNKCLLQGFNIVKFGISPNDNIKRTEKEPVIETTSQDETKTKRKIKIIKND